MITRIKVDRRCPRYRWFAFIIGIVLIVIIATSFLYFRNDLPFWLHTTQAPTTTGNSYTKGSASEGGTSGHVGSDSEAGGQPSSSRSEPITGQTLLAPWGTAANIYSATMDEQMGSTCNTTPGATCQVIFVNGNITKNLSPETADAGGAIYWAWRPKDIGLIPGTWHMSLKAILGGQTRTTSNDPLTLEITQ